MLTYKKKIHTECTELNLVIFRVMLFMMSSKFFHWCHGQTILPCMHAGDTYAEMFANVYSMDSLYMDKKIYHSGDGSSASTSTVSYLCANLWQEQLDIAPTQQYYIGPTSTASIVPTLFQPLTNVGPNISQRLPNVALTFSQPWSNVPKPSATLRQHYPNLIPMCSQHTKTS